MKRLGLLLLSVVAGCKAEAGTYFLITDAPAPASGCNFNPDTTTIRPSGFFDPTGSGAFVLSVRLENNMSNDVDRAALTGDSNFRIDGNDITLVGFDVCYYRGDLPATGGFDADRDDLPVDCDDLPDSQKQFVYAAGTVSAGGGRLATLVDVLSAPVLKALYGEAFDPASLVVGSTTVAGRNVISFDVLSPVPAAGRSPAWGNFPEASSANVVVQLRAFGRTESGAGQRSNWFAYAVEICPGCVLATCGDWLECANAPGLYEGQRIPSDACFPFSGLDPSLECEDFSQCPE